MTNSELATIPEGGARLTELTMPQIFWLGQQMIQAGMFGDGKNAAQAAVKIMAGQALGLDPVTSMRGIYTVGSNFGFRADLVGARIKANPKYDYRIIAHSEEKCVIQFWEIIAGKRVEIGQSEFTQEDAKRQGTKNMEKLPKNMLLSRALVNGARWYCPDVMMGMPMEGEGEVIDDTSEEKTPEQEAEELREAEARLNRRNKAANAGQKGLKTQEAAPEPAQPPDNTEPANDTPEAAEPAASVSNEPQSDVETVTPEPDTQVEGDPSTYMNPATGQEEPFASSEPDPDGKHTDNQRKSIMAQLNAYGFTKDAEKRQVVAGILGKADMISFTTVTYAEAEKLKAGLKTSDGQLLRTMFVKAEEQASA